MKKSFTLFLTGMLACMYAISSPAYSPESLPAVTSNLYIAATGGTTVLMDGVLTQYDPSFSNNIDGLDARKMSNSSENIGLSRGTTTLVIERRHTINVTDTIFYKIWNLRQLQNYRLELLTGNLNQPGMSAYAEDLYLHTKTNLDLDGSNYVNFSINADPASSDAHRFRVIFNIASGGTLPLTFTSVKAWQQKEGVTINWKTGNEYNLENYEVEKSADGKSFTNLGSVKANNRAENTYDYTDMYPAAGYNYYRVRSTGINGAIAYSDVMKVYLDKGFSVFRIFPNPVTGNNIHLQLINQPAGEYEVRLISNFGQTMLTTKIQHPGGSSIQTIVPSQHLVKGMYQLEIIQPGGKISTISVAY